MRLVHSENQNNSRKRSFFNTFYRNSRLQLLLITAIRGMFGVVGYDGREVVYLFRVTTNSFRVQLHHCRETVTTHALSMNSVDRTTTSASVLGEIES